MKIKIPAMTVEVDAEAWALEYGVDAKEVRAHVVEYFTNGFHPQGQVDLLGLAPKSKEDDIRWFDFDKGAYT